MTDFKIFRSEVYPATTQPTYLLDTEDREISLEELTELAQEILNYCAEEHKRIKMEGGEK